MDFNVNVHVKIEGLDQLISTLTSIASLISNVKAPTTAAATEPVVVSATEEKPRRGRPRKAKAEEPQPEVPQPEALGPKVEESQPEVPQPEALEPKAEEPKAEEPQPEAPKALSEEDAKKMLGELRTACVKLSKAADANRVLAVIQSFGYKSLTSVPVEKYGELLELINAEIEVAEGK